MCARNFPDTLLSVSMPKTAKWRSTAGPSCRGRLGAIIYTDIGRDGMMSGVNIEATVKLAEAISIPVIASGGITNLEDIRQLCEVGESGIVGAVPGRAVYEGTLDFAVAQKLADELTKKK